MEIPNLSQWQNARLFLLISLILQELSRRMEVVMSPVEFVHQGPEGLTAIGTHENEGTEANGWGGANNVHVNEEEEEVAEGDDAPPWRQPIDHEEGPQEPPYPPPKRRRFR